MLLWIRNCSVERTLHLIRELEVLSLCMCKYRNVNIINYNIYVYIYIYTPCIILYVNIYMYIQTISMNDNMIYVDSQLLYLHMYGIKVVL